MKGGGTKENTVWSCLVDVMECLQALLVTAATLGNKGVIVTKTVYVKRFCQIWMFG